MNNNPSKHIAATAPRLRSKGETDMNAVEKHGNVWMLIRKNSEGVVAVIRSFRTERAARNALARLA